MDALSGRRTLWAIWQRLRQRSACTSGHPQVPTVIKLRAADTRQHPPITLDGLLLLMPLPQMAVGGPWI
jgi:hypothetical protein